MRNPESTNIPYARFPGQVIAAPPCRMLNANMYGFFIKGKQSSIQKYIDQTLNQVKLPKGHYQALTDFCMLTFTDIENIKPTSEPFASQGYFQETDIIIWLPVAHMIEGKMDHLYWYPAFICVNNIYALVNGRETWGFNKYLCDYTMPTADAPNTDFTITVDAFTKFSPDTKMAPVELFSVKQTSAHSKKSFAAIAEIFEAGEEMFKNVLKMDLDMVKQLFDSFWKPQVDQLLFKQLPDGQAKNAVYQAVCHSPSTVQKIHSIHMHFSGYEFNLNQVDMFPLQEMFGIDLGTQPAILPFNVLFDFNQDAAFTIAENK
ncbi:hypothetical protein DS2_00920 [Catenovulum agarivorans DS-2]|uniref:Acetoacetate decarboxylase n=1 Tax=Catenovulum agarivorans DS-2 TaxID=1328313 RepID=W7QH22_9ALTE|nr:acetoacetate decarboxylase [Catenovulum agarivorans]EWH12239.1 hypothetical protein DS2_00920 [Catenovulum agarivorans DS-2]